MTFAVVGLASVVLSWLIVRGSTLSRSVGYLGVVFGILLVALYIAYTVILDASNPVVLVLILISGVVQPVWYLWLGWAMRQSQPSAPAMRAKARR